MTRTRTAVAATAAVLFVAGVACRAPASASVPAVWTPVGTLRAYIFAADCASPTSCVGLLATGQGDVHLVGWDGQMWSVLPASLPEGRSAPYTALSCPEAGLCYLAATAPARDGSPAHPLLVRWDGTTATEVPLGLSGDDRANALACASASSCLLHLVPPGTQPGGVDVAGRIVHWNGTAAAPVPTPAGVTLETGPNRLTCPAPDTCAAVASQLGFPGIARWSGQGWAFTPLVGGNGGWPDVHGVACAGPTFCAAVGVESAGTGTALRATAAVATGTATLWSSLSPLAPAEDQPDPPFDLVPLISCSSPTWCVAVGSEYAAGGDTTGLPATLVWTGTGWHRGPPRAVDRVPLGVIDCAPASRWCVAGGSFGVADVLQPTDG